MRLNSVASSSGGEVIDMLIEGLISIVLFLVKLVMAVLPDLPGLPDSAIASITNVINMAVSNAGALIGIFVRVSTLKAAIPILIVLMQFDHILEFITWILRKVPFLNWRD